MELKKATTFTEQVELLKRKGVHVPDDEECRIFLSHVNYYYFSGFLLPYIDRKANKCLDPVSFDQLTSLFDFDVELRNLLAGVVERIEMYMRTTVSNYHALKYGPEGYLDIDSFGDKHNKDKFDNIIDKCISDHKSTAIVMHHQKKYSGHFPLWVIIEFLSIGSLSHFYGDMKNEDKKYISVNNFGVNYQILDSWMRCLTDLRNKCAHCSRLYYWTFTAIPRFPKHFSYVADRRVFTQILMLKMMYPYPEKWNKDFSDKFVALIDKYSDYICYKHLGMPDNWKDYLYDKLI